MNYNETTTSGKNNEPDFGKRAAEIAFQKKNDS